MSKRATANPKTVSVKHAAGSASQALIAAPAAGLFLRIFRIIATVRISAAQIVDVGVSAGTDAQQLFSLAASAVGPVYFESDSGFDLPSATALTSVAALAGPEIRYFVEYEVKQQ